MSKEDKSRRSRAASSGTIRRPAGRWARLTREVKDRWQRLLARDPFWVVLFLLVTTWALLPRGAWFNPSIEVGSIATRDYVAPRDALVPDRETTEEKQRRAREEVLPVYDFDPAAAERVNDQITALFAAAREELERPDERGAASAEEGAEEGTPEDRIREATPLRVSDEQLELLRRSQLSPELEERLRGAVESMLQRGVVVGKARLLENRSRGVVVRNLRSGEERLQLDLFDYLDYPDQLREELRVELRGWPGLRQSDRTLLLDFLTANVSPNLHLNQSETLARQEAAAAAVEQVYNRVRKGQVIVRKGDQVDATQARLVAAMSGEPSVRARILPVLGVFLLLSLVVLVLWLGIRREKVVEIRRASALGELLLLLMVSILGVRMGEAVASGLAGGAELASAITADSLFLAIPYAATALVTALLYGRVAALLVSILLSLLAGQVVGEASWWVVVYAMAGSMGAIFAVDPYQFKERSVTVKAGVVVAAVNLITVLMLYAISGDYQRGGRLLFDLLGAATGGLLVSAVASFLVPVMESVFSVTTGIKLVELANTNLPLLRRLAFEAPGTFQHSLMVANLSKAACEAIGADSVLAYTGALYHDVGKIYRPEYYIENQWPGQNRHDKLLPSMSALILTSHVKDGLDLARAHHLPEPIEDAIAQHHGTRLITFFYERARKLQDPECGEVSEEKFRYPGPKPQDKVMGVLMLADGVEAASRTLVEPSPAKIRSVIKAITDDCLRDGQLDETDLTLSDLSELAKAFQRVLSHIHHHRVDYPGFDFNQRASAREAADGLSPPPAELPAMAGEEEDTAAAAVHRAELG